ncbi:MAG TPA: PEGA domain-containing protein [Polyangiaceae bacterium]
MRTGSLRWGRVLAGVFVAGALACLQAPSAWAQQGGAAAGGAAKPAAKADLGAAKKHYAEGEKKYKAGDFAGAETEFKAANDIKSAPPTERYIGLCEDNLGHLQTAVDWYDKFLAHVPEKMADKGDEIRKREGEIKALPGKVHIDSTPPGASITIDDKPQSAPTPTDVDLAPGSHTIKLTETGRLPSTKTVDVAFASTQTVSASLDPEPPAAAPPPPVAATPPPEAPPPAPPPPPPEPRSKVPAYVTGGLAIVAAGVGTVFGIMTLSDKSDFDKNPTTSTADNGDTHALITDMAFGVALTFGVTSAVLFLTKDEAPAQASAAHKAVTAKAASGDSGLRQAGHVTITPTPMVGAHSGGAGLTVRF